MNWRVAPIALGGVLAVLGINAWLLAAIALQIMSGGSDVIEKANWTFGQPGPAGSITDRKPIEAYRQILAHLVFFKSREPFVPPAPRPPPPLAAAPPAMVVDPGLVLGGVMITDGMKKAYLFSKTNATGAWTTEGGDFMGWLIRSVDGTGARLEQGGRSLQLQLYPRE